jgi:tetratricopeptide (TPR) repeat protein
MYLKGSKFNMQSRRQRSNPWRVIFLFVLVGAAVYVNQVIVPVTPPLFVPTPTATRSPESYVADAESLMSQGKISQAIQAYQQAIQADPKNSSNFIILARLQIYSGDYEGAIISAENSLLLNSNNSMSHAMLGWARGLNGEYLEGIGSLNRAIELEPNNATAYACLAEITALQVQDGQGDLGSLDKAVQASRKAIELNPNLMETHRARGTVLEITANYEEAAKEFEAAIAQNTNIADLHLALGRNYRALEMYEKAIEEFNRANALNPADPMPDTLISRTYATVGEYAKAIQYAQQAVKDTPEDAYMHGNLGSMYYRNRQYPEAVNSLKLAVRGGTTEEGAVVEGLPLDYGRVAEYFYSYGLALARTGDCGEALQISQAVQLGVPNDEVSMYNAEEIINLCKTVMKTPSGSQLATPTVEGAESLEGDVEGMESTPVGDEESALEETPTVE